MRRVVFQLKDTDAADWARKNPVLQRSEPGVESDTGKFKIGDGVTAWSDLPYFQPVDPNASATDLAAHIASPTPHPAYDDGPSLVLLYENAKV